ncbi:MAG TPA: universal stress protein [Longimicrobiales bacterium]
MRALRSVVVPLDGSILAEAALPLAVEIARRAGALLHLVQVPAPVPVALVGAGAGWDDEPDDAYVVSAADRLGRQAPHCLTAALGEGGPMEGLAEYAHSCQADLVVLATHGHGPLDRAWIGSFSERLLESFPVPLLIVRPPRTHADLAGALRNVSILLDGSTRAESILDPVTQIGGLFDGRYVLLRVTPAPSDRELNRARDYLEEVAQVLRGRGLRTATLVLPGRDVAAAAANFVWAAGADLIALATHGRCGVERELRGSVAQELLRLGPAPLLSIRAPGE